VDDEALDLTGLANFPREKCSSAVKVAGSQGKGVGQYILMAILLLPRSGMKFGKLLKQPRNR
jgi:hypothetical protein